MFDSLIRFIDSMRSVSLVVAGCSLSLGVRCRLVFAVARCSLSLGVRCRLVSMHFGSKLEKNAVKKAPGTEICNKNASGNDPDKPFPPENRTEIRFA